MALQVPEWCEWRRGTSPLLFVAPHGGRRPAIDAAAPAPHLRVNDLYTPQITRALADRLAAGVVINHGQDRNGLDLNRTSQVCRRARWFLELLAGQVEAIIDAHGCAEVVFVHGWNTGQPKCDVGIGAVEREGGLHVAAGAHLTVSDTYRHERIEALRAACAEAEIAVSIGERYPGGHANNVLQLFTAREPILDDPCARQIAGWSMTGRVNALQLEIGIPLRWPGVWRDKFVGAVVRAFGRSPLSQRGGRGDFEPAPQIPLNPPVSKGEAHRTDSTVLSTRDSALSPPNAALQFYDPAVDVGMFASVGRVGRSSGGRLLLFLGGQRVALFTGEQVNARGACVAPLEFVGDSGCLRLHFGGPVLVLEDGARYLDLETALAASALTAGAVELEFRCIQRSLAGSRAEFGAVSGHVCVGGRQLRVDAGGFANAGALRAYGSEGQTMIAAAFGAQRGVLSRVGAGGTGPLAVCFGRDASAALNHARIAVSTDGDLYTPAMLELVCEDQAPVRGRALSRMAILRPAGDGKYLRVTLGTARFQWGDLDGYGLYEHAVVQ